MANRVSAALRRGALLAVLALVAGIPAAARPAADAAPPLAPLQASLGLDMRLAGVSGCKLTSARNPVRARRDECRLA